MSGWRSRRIHGVAPSARRCQDSAAARANLDAKALREQANSLLSKKFGKQAEYVRELDYPLAWLNEDAFTAAGRKRNRRGDSTQARCSNRSGLGWIFHEVSAWARETSIPNTELGRRYAHSYSPEGGWYVMGVPKPFEVGITKGTDHATPFSYDTHVPLAFYGLAFQPGVYRTHAEPVDLAVTLASLLGINAPAQSYRTSLDGGAGFASNCHFWFGRARWTRRFGGAK